MKVEQKLKDILLSTATDENGRCWIERYIKVIESFKDNGQYDSSKFQYHHIVPRSIDKSLVRYKPNIIILTPRQHILVHHLLAKIKTIAYVRGLLIVLKVNKEYVNISMFNHIINQANDYIAELTGRPTINLTTGETYYSLNCAVRITKLTNIGEVINRPGTSGGYYWCYVDQLENLERLTLDRKIEEIQRIMSQRLVNKQTVSRSVINLNTKQVFKSAIEASQSLGMNDMAVASSIRSQYRLCGYFFQYADRLKDLTDETIENELKKLTDKVQSNQPFYKSKRCQCIETGEIFESTVKASRSMGLSDGTVSISIAKNRKLRNGTTWKYI